MGSGKTTILRHLKTVLTPHGKRTGEILFNGINLKDVDNREQSSKIGYVMQNSDDQIVTDKVWHELAFGLENRFLKNSTERNKNTGCWRIKMGFELCHPAINLIYFVSVMYGMLKQPKTVYDQKIIITPIAPMSYYFYIGYAVFVLCCLVWNSTPNTVSEKQVKRLSDHIPKNKSV